MTIEIKGVERMKWIEFTKFNKYGGKERFAIPVNRILSVYEVTDAGSCIVTREEQGTLNTHVSQDYNSVVEKLNTLGTELIDTMQERLNHHDHMGGVYQTRILRLEKKVEELQSAPVDTTITKPGCICLASICHCPTVVEAVE